MQDAHQEVGLNQQGGVKRIKLWRRIRRIISCSQAVLEPTRQFQPFVCVQRRDCGCVERQHEPSAACSASGEKSSSCSNRDFDSLACTSSKHSIAWNAGQVSWRTCNPQIAGATMPLLPEIRIVFSLSCCLDSRVLDASVKNSLPAISRNEAESAGQ